MVLSKRVVLSRSAPDKVWLWSCFYLKFKAKKKKLKMESNVLIHKLNSKDRKEWIKRQGRQNTTQIHPLVLLVKGPIISFKIFFQASASLFFQSFWFNVSGSPPSSPSTPNLVNPCQVYYWLFLGKTVLPCGAGKTPHQLPGCTPVTL